MSSSVSSSTNDSVVLLLSVFYLIPLALGVWNLIPLAIWWSVWKERNRRIFERKDLSLLDFKMYFLRVLYTWSQALEDRVNLTFVDFVDNLMQGY